MSKLIDTMKSTLLFVEGSMERIDQISLENDLYNELYLALREMRSSVTHVIRAQYAIDKHAEESEFWSGMKETRHPDADIVRDGR